MARAMYSTHKGRVRQGRHRTGHGRTFSSGAGAVVIGEDGLSFAGGTNSAYADAQVVGASPSAISGMVWFKGTNDAATRYILAEYLTIGDERRWALAHEVTTGFLRFLSSTTGTAATTVSITATSNSITDGEWHLVGFKWQPGTNNVELYVDGYLAGTGTGAASISTETNTVFQIGGVNAPSAVGQTMVAEVLHARVWERFLDDSEFRDAAVGKPVSATGLVGEWYINEGEGTTAADGSGNGNNLTIQGATWTDTSDWAYKEQVGTFDGVGDYISLPFDFDGATSYNIKCDFLCEPTASTLVLLDASDSGVDGVEICMTSAGALTASHNGTLVDVGSGLDDGAWHTLEVDWDGATLTVTVDAISANGAVATALSLSTNAYIGARQ